MQEFEGRVAVVTGAASGIGLGMARAFTAAGMRVVLADVESAALDAATKVLIDRGHEVMGVRTDVSRLEDIEELAARTLERFGSINVLCNNAGVGIAGPVPETSLEDWRWTLDVDLWGPIYGVHVFLPLIAESGEGHINSTASMAGLLAGGSLAAYNVAKHGVVALMASLARDLSIAHSPITASVLCPGPIKTNIITSQRNRDPADADRHIRSETGERYWARLTEHLAHGMDPDEVGPMVLDAIANGRFWVFTHPEMVSVVEHQVQQARTDATLPVF